MAGNSVGMIIAPLSCWFSPGVDAWSSRSKELAKMRSLPKSNRLVSSHRTILTLEELERRDTLSAIANPAAVASSLALVHALTASGSLVGLRGLNPPQPLTTPSLLPAISSPGPTETLTSTRLNSNTINGSIIPEGTLEDEAYVTLPSPYSRLSGHADDPITRTPALSGTQIGLGESFKGSNDQVTDMTNVIQGIMTVPL
jgi:hypothetical protein